MRRSGARDTTVLAIGSGLSGLLAYVFFSLVTHALGSVRAAPVSVLWTYWSAAAAVLTFPLQHWITRTAAVDEGEVGVRRALPGIARVVLATALVAGGLAWVGRAPLFHRDDLVFPALIAGVTVGSGFVGIVRGVLTARARFGSVAAALFGENALRASAAAVLLVADVRRAWAYGLALLFGQLVGLLWPSALRLGASGVRRASERPLAFLGGVAGGSLIGQIVLTGGPVLLALRGGSPSEVTALFATLALFRAPYTLSVGVVAQVTGRLTTLVANEQHDVLRRIRVLVVAGTGVATIAGAVIGAAVGPELVRAVFGSNVRIAAAAAAVIGAGSALAMANLVITLGLIARGRGGAVLRSWVAASAIGAVGLALGSHPLDAVVAVFAIAEAVAFVLMAVEEARSPLVRGTAA